MPSSLDLTDDLISRMAEDLQCVDGVEAVALGGSRACGAHTDASDYDVGVYYAQERLRVDELEALAEKWVGRPTAVAGPGAWGPWVDGGGWLSVSGTPVDWILRDVDRVDQQCERAIKGLFGFHTQPGHPLGFLDVSYAGEVATARVLGDPNARLATWKRRLDPYPDALRRALIENAWQVQFDLDAARKGAVKADTSYVALCCTHAALLCAHGWHAYANTWVINEKGLIANVDRLPVETGTFTQDVQEIIGQLGATGYELHRAIDRLEVVLQAAVKLLDGPSSGVAGAP